MNADINDFMSKNQPKYKLRKYEDEIIFLFAQGYTQSKILEYLSEYHNEKVSRQTLSNQIKFLKKTKKNGVIVTTDSSINNESAISENDKKKALNKMKTLGEGN